MKQEEVTVKGEKLVDNYYLFEETIEDDRKETFTDIEKNSIQLSDMYSFMTKTYHRMDTEIPYLSRDIIPLKVADNETNSYREALINILYANLLEKGVQVIVIRRERGEESYYANDFEYTGMVIVDKGTFEIAYYVERGSYDSDGKDAVDGLINEAERLGVHVARLTATERINIEKEIKCIVDRYNNPWSELYEHRKAISEANNLWYNILEVIQTGKYHRERAEYKSHISNPAYISKTNLIFFYGRCKVVHYAYFCRSGRGSLHHF